MDRMAAEIRTLVKQLLYLQQQQDEINMGVYKEEEAGNGRQQSRAPAASGDEDSIVEALNHQTQCRRYSQHSNLHNDLMGPEYQMRRVLRHLDRALVSLQELVLSLVYNKNTNNNSATKQEQTDCEGTADDILFLPKCICDDLVTILTSLRFAAGETPTGQRNRGSAAEEHELICQIHCQSARVLLRYHQEHRQQHGNACNFMTPKSFGQLLRRIALYGDMNAAATTHELETASTPTAEPEKPDWRVLAAWLDIVVETWRPEENDGNNSNCTNEEERYDVAAESLSLLFHFLPRAIDTLCDNGTSGSTWKDMVIAQHQDQGFANSSNSCDPRKISGNATNSPVDGYQVDACIKWRIVTGYLMEEVLPMPFHLQQQRQHQQDNCIHKTSNMIGLDQWLLQQISQWNDPNDGQKENEGTFDQRQDAVREMADYLYALLDQYVHQQVAFAVDVMDGATVLINNNKNDTCQEAGGSHHSNNNGDSLVKLWAIDECLRQVGMTTLTLQLLGPQQQQQQTFSRPIVKDWAVQAKILWRGMSECLLEGTEHTNLGLRSRLCYSTLRLADLVLPCTEILSEGGNSGEGAAIAETANSSTTNNGLYFSEDLQTALCTTFLRGVEFPELLLSSEHVLKAVEKCCCSNGRNLGGIERTAMVKEMLQASILTMQTDPMRAALARFQQQHRQNQYDQELIQYMLRMLAPNMPRPDNDNSGPGTAANNPKGRWDDYFLQHLDPAYVQYLHVFQQNQQQFVTTTTTMVAPATAMGGQY